MVVTGEGVVMVIENDESKVADTQQVRRLGKIFLLLSNGSTALKNAFQDNYLNPFRQVDLT